MKSWIVALALTVSSLAAQASTATFEFVGFVGLEPNSFHRIYLRPLADGKIELRSTHGTEVIEVQINNDLRGTDGPAIVDLGNGRRLIVTSGFGPDGKVSYYLDNGKFQIELHPTVYATFR